MIEEKLKRMCWTIIGAAAVLMIIIYLTLEEHPHSAFLITWSFSVLSAFMSTSLAVLLFDVWLGGDIRQQRDEMTANSIGVAVRRAMGFRAHGVVGIHAAFNLEAFCSSAKKSQSIFILQTYAPNMQSIRPALLDVLDNGGEVRLALLNPESDFVAIRATETPKLHRNKSVEAFKSGILYDCLSRFEQIAESKKSGKALVGFYDRSPGVCIYATDEMMLVGPFLSNTDAVTSPMVEIKANTEAYKIFVDHFEIIWDGCEIKEI